MSKLYKKTLFIFRRDLRLVDNTGLIRALEDSNQVLPSFFLDPRLLKQSSPHLNAIQFMAEALQDLDLRLQHQNSQLLFSSGIPEKMIFKLLKTYEIDAVFINRDYSPFSRQRDAQIRNVCKKAKVAFHQFADSLLNEPEMILKANNEPYKVFTPYFRKALELPISLPKENSFKNYVKIRPGSQKKVTVPFKHIKTKNNKSLLVQGSRTAALAILSNLQDFRQYKITRDFPNQHGTTRLSAYIKFGSCSVREVYNAIKKQLGINHPLIRQLYWRDFYTHIAFHYPHVFEGAFKPRYNKIQWNNDKMLFETWRKGMTGFPIVDAGIRELNETGWMHNRVRMIVASFLTKDLHINWQWGERYFASKLVDYDPAVNNGNWQWAASTGVDAQPYFRIFNPWLQQIKYDADCEYIKKWIPDLSKLEPKIIHTWHKPTKWDSKIKYPKPVVDHKVESQYSKELYAATFSAK